MRVWMSACIHGFLVYVHNSPVCFRCQVSCVLPLADAFPHAKGVQTFRGLVRSHEFRQERASEAFSSSCTLGVQGKDQVCQLLDVLLLEMVFELLLEQAIQHAHFQEILTMAQLLTFIKLELKKALFLYQEQQYLITVLTYLVGHSYIMKQRK